MDAPAQPQPAPSLQYPVRPRWHARRRFRPLLVACVVFMVAAQGRIGWKQYGPRLQKRVQMLAAQRECLQYRMPPDTVVVRRGADEAFPAAPWVGTVFKRPRGGAGPWSRFHDNHVSRRDPDGGETLLTSDGTLFLHERRNPRGERRLIAVDLRVSWHRKVTLFTADRRVVIPGTLRADPTTAAPTDGTAMAPDQELLAAPYGNEVRIFAGQPDPADPSHFTIEYQVDGRRETIDGWLRDNDGVSLTLRHASDVPRPR